MAPLRQREAADRLVPHNQVPAWCLPVDSCLSPLSKVKFGEAADQDSQELFGLISQFVQDFRRTHADLRSGVTAVDQSS